MEINETYLELNKFWFEAFYKFCILNKGKNQNHFQENFEENFQVSQLLKSLKTFALSEHLKQSSALRGNLCIYPTLKHQKQTWKFMLRLENITQDRAAQFSLAIF